MIKYTLGSSPCFFFRHYFNICTASSFLTLMYCSVVVVFQDLAYLDPDNDIGLVSQHLLVPHSKQLHELGFSHVCDLKFRVNA